MNLSLDICNNVTIKYNIPVRINEEEIYKHNPNDDFYTDKCNKHSIDGNVDMTQYDRKNNYNNNNYALCESNCEFLGYNGSTSKVICDCKIKNHLNYKDNEAGNLLNKMDNKKSNSNLDITQCITDFIAPEHIKSNGGFYSILFIIIIFIIVFIIYCTKGKSLIENKIDNIIYKKFKKNSHKKRKTVLTNNSKINKNHNKKKKVTKKSQKIKINPINSPIHNKKGSIIENVISRGRKDRNIKKVNLNKKILKENKYKPDNDYELNISFHILFFQ